MPNELLIPNVGAIQPQPQSGEAALRKGADGGAFEKTLREKLPGAPLAKDAPAAAPSALKFSSHALNRIKDRSISMGSELMSKLEKAVDTAAQKGSKESLILSNDAAFIVSVKNKTVITVLDRNQMNGNVFTNIDSTVVI
ncbi:MAG TPA: TIGR02530 family flagellar biosynthesis protein [Bdellovibrionota bacterium]|jgi:flagellar operon protein